MSEQAEKRQAERQRGMSIFIVAVGLTLLLAIAGFSVDLANLYVARNEAQRAADAAAIAGAQQWVNDGFTSGLIGNTLAAQDAANHAAQIGNQNKIIGLSPDLLPTGYSMSCPPTSGASGMCFNFATADDPQITVVVKKDMPTYFMKVLGISSVPVSVKATAEAYNPAGAAGPTTSVQCLKPWLLPNCDYLYPRPWDDPETNQNCGSFTQGGQQMGYSYFVDPNNNDAIVRPGLTPNGAIGELLQVKPGIPGDAEAPSKFWPVFLPGNGIYTCPSCASNDQANSTSNSAALYRENIECCSTNQITCGTTTVDPINGDMTGPTGQGVDCLIHEGSDKTGQDCISIDTSPTCPGVSTSLALPFTMYAGSANPYHVTPGSQITTSDSLVTLPLYDGSALCPGNSGSPDCPSSVSVDIVGFLQLFLRDVGGQQNSVWAYVLNVSGCGSGQVANGGDNNAVPVYTGSPIPVRLIHN